MPGKPDHTNTNGPGQFFPGEKAYRAWDEGWRYRYSGTAAQRPITDNPFDATNFPEESKAWNTGWNEAAANSAGKRRMPATSGVAAAAAGTSATSAVPTPTPPGGQQ